MAMGRERGETSVSYLHKYVKIWRKEKLGKGYRDGEREKERKANKLCQLEIFHYASVSH